MKANGNDTVQLQGIGLIDAIKTEDLKPNMLLCWNNSYGEYYVKSIEKVSKCFYKITEINIETGEESTRRSKATKLIGIVADEDNNIYFYINGKETMNPEEDKEEVEECVNMKMYKEVYTGGGDNEMVEVVELSQQEIKKIRNESILNLVDGFKRGYFTKEEFNKTVKEMNITNAELKELGLNEIIEQQPELNIENLLQNVSSDITKNDIQSLINYMDNMTKEEQIKAMLVLKEFIKINDKYNYNRLTS